MNTQQRFQQAAARVARALTPRELATVTKLLRLITEAHHWGFQEQAAGRDLFGDITYKATLKSDLRWQKPFMAAVMRKYNIPRKSKAA